MGRKDTGRLAIVVLAASFLAATPLTAPPGAFADPAAEVPVGTLEVTVTGFESAGGRLAIALFATAEDYWSRTNAVRRAWLDIEDGRSRWTVEHLPEGEYALIAYQDLNGNEQIDMRLFGMPKEPVGVSNDARGLFGPPRFDSAKFQFEAPVTRHGFRLR